jgi:hypothetical protein
MDQLDQHRTALRLADARRQLVTASVAEVAARGGAVVGQVVNHHGRHQPQPEEDLTSSA